jgi:hypothetical protein
MFSVRTRRLAAISLAVTAVSGSVALAQFVVPRITLQVADWLPPWDAAAGGGWGVVPTNAPPGQWTQFSGSARQLTVQPGRYDVYWLQRGGNPPLLIAYDLAVGAAGAAVAVSTGVKLVAADWAHLDGSAHWAAATSGQQGSIVAEATGSAMMLPLGDFDIYWKAGEEAGFGWVTKVTIASPSTGSMGLQVEARADGVRVVTPAPGGPADRAGLRADDLITAVDGTTVVGLDAAAALTRLRGPPSTTARLSVSRGGSALTISLTRDPQQSIQTVTINSGVRLQFAAGQSLPLDKQTGWWGAVLAGANIDNTIPTNRSRNTSQPLTLPPGTYDLYWAANVNTPVAPLAKGVVVAAGKITDATAGR